jgi:Calx-beta domain
VINGNASARCDYSAAIGTIHFAAGESFKTINIPLTDDGYAEGNENFTVSLSNPAGATLGSPSTATVTITDNESTTGANSVDASDFFVHQHYIDFLSREPDSSGFVFWTNQIIPCGSNQQCIDSQRVNISAAFFLSIEFQQTGYLVERIYKAAYGNASGISTLGGAHQLAVPIVRFNEFLPDTQEIGQGVIVNQGNWQQQLENNKQAFITEFVQRSRFTTAFPNTMTPAQFVDTLNANAGNPLSPAERNQLVNDLATNVKTRAQVLRAVAEDPDLVNAEFNRAFVLMQFFGYLRRNPNDAPDSDYTGYDFWLTKLNQFNGNFQNAEMVKAFITSGEYRQRFGP